MPEKPTKSDQPKPKPDQAQIQRFEATIANCDNGLILLDSCIFSGGLTPRIQAHKEWLSVMKEGLQRQLYKAQDEQSPKAS